MFYIEGCASRFLAHPAEAGGVSNPGDHPSSFHIVGGGKLVWVTEEG